MKNNFESVKSQIIQIAKDNNACKDEFKLALESTNYNELLKVIVKNSNWCYSFKILHKDILSQIPDDELVRVGIYYCKKDIIQKEGFALYYSSTSEHYGSSTSKHYGSSTSEHYNSSTSKHYGSSTSEHYGSSTSEHYDSSTSEHYDSSTSKHYGSSTSEHYGSSTSEHYYSSTSEHYGSSTSKHYNSSTSKHYDSSTSKHYNSSTSEHYGSSTSEHYENNTYGSVYTLNNPSIIFDNAIIRERSSGKIYLKKDKNTIEYLD